ncbi:MAG: riboflavin biosynthesis protein RibF [Planctomycetes bacterium]|nr:riboflavin biosynthesis protein RibF [Planctomycetota bacterium]
MRTYHADRLDRVPGAPRGGAATLGVFDGVHLGHQRILTQLTAVAAEMQAPSLVLTFSIHPVAVVRGLPPRLITSLPHRMRLFQSCGVQECIVLPFDAAVRGLEARAFADQVFVHALGVRALVLGPDAHIGRDRGGDAEFLGRYCLETGIRLEVVPDLHLDGVRVSSTRIRAAIADGDLERASRMLGRPVSLLGTVVRGDGRGGKLGFATANLNLHHEIRPPAGVYAVRVRIDGREERGVLNIGRRPTFSPDGGLTVEAHLIDFSGDLYGLDLEVLPVQRIRDEMRFESVGALVAQIGRDIEEARRILA